MGKRGLTHGLAYFRTGRGNRKGWKTWKSRRKEENSEGGLIVNRKDIVLSQGRVCKKGA